MAVLVVDGKAVSICASVRITDEGHEAGVDTAPPSRGRDYAALVVTAWANAVREMGRGTLVQHVVDEHGVAVRRAQVGARPLRERPAHHVNPAGTLDDRHSLT